MSTKRKENAMKKIPITAALVVSLLVPFISRASTVRCTVDEYKLVMYVYVPRIYDNNTSLGYRKYQKQKISGVLQIAYPNDCSSPVILVEDLVNKTQKLSNKSTITYKCKIDSGVMYPRVNLIGNNMTGKFHTGSVNFYLDAEPSYNRGEDDEDNSLLITLAGRGYTKSVGTGRRMYSIKGNLAGTLGCGCYAYGHTSPTRVAAWRGPSSTVDDVAAVWGSWTATYKTSYSATLVMDDDEDND